MTSQVPLTFEQRARDMIGRMGFTVTHLSSGDVVELSNLLAEVFRLRAAAAQGDHDLMEAFAWYNRRLPFVMDRALEKLVMEIEARHGVRVPIIGPTITADPAHLLVQYREYRRNLAPVETAFAVPDDSHG